MEPVRVVKHVQYTEIVPVTKQIPITVPEVVMREIEVMEPRLVTKTIQVIENVPVMRQAEVVEIRNSTKEVESFEPQTFTKQVEVTEYVPAKKQVEVTEPVTLKKAVEFVQPVITTQTITKEMQQPVVVDQKVTTTVGQATVVGVETEYRQEVECVERLGGLQISEQERLQQWQSELGAQKQVGGHSTGTSSYSSTFESGGVCDAGVTGISSTGVRGLTTQQQQVLHQRVEPGFAGNLVDDLTNKRHRKF